jgi:hypothetical protein
MPPPVALAAVPPVPVRVLYALGAEELQGATQGRCLGDRREDAAARAGRRWQVEEDLQRGVLHLVEGLARTADQAAGDKVAVRDNGQGAAEQTAAAGSPRISVVGETVKVTGGEPAGTRLAGSERETATVIVPPAVSTPVTLPTKANSWRGVRSTTAAAGCDTSAVSDLLGPPLNWATKLSPALMSATPPDRPLTRIRVLPSVVTFHASGLV